MPIALSHLGALGCPLQLRLRSLPEPVYLVGCPRPNLPCGKQTCVRDSNPGYTTAFGLDFPAACRINRYCFSHRVTLSTHPSLLQEGVRNLRSRFCRGLVTLRATCSPVGFGVFNKCGLCIGKAGDGSSFKNSSGSCCEMEWQRWFRARLRLALRSLFCSQPVNLGRRAELLPDGLWLWLLLGKS